MMFAYFPEHLPVARVQPCFVCLYDLGYIHLRGLRVTICWHGSRHVYRLPPDKCISCLIEAPWSEQYENAWNLLFYLKRYLSPQQRGWLKKISENWKHVTRKEIG